jgi:hypothetical protein
MSRALHSVLSNEGNSWQYLAIPGNTWQCLAIPDKTFTILNDSKQYVTICNNTEQFQAILNNTLQTWYQMVSFLISNTSSIITNMITVLPWYLHSIV